MAYSCIHVHTYTSRLMLNSCEPESFWYSEFSSNRNKPRQRHDISESAYHFCPPPWGLTVAITVLTSKVVHLRMPTTARIDKKWRRWSRLRNATDSCCTVLLLTAVYVAMLEQNSFSTRWWPKHAITDVLDRSFPGCTSYPQQDFQDNDATETVW